MKFLSKRRVSSESLFGSQRRNILKRIFYTIPSVALIFKASGAGLQGSEGNVSANEDNQLLPGVNGTDSRKSIGTTKQNDSNIFIKQVASVNELKLFKPEFQGQQIRLASWHLQDWDSVSSPSGGGVLYSILNRELEEDGGTIFRVDDNWCWVRDVSENINAEWFGVTGDGLAREENISRSIDFITKNGGTLNFPSGRINFGLLRKRIEYFEGIQKFKIKGQGYSTVLTFDNIDPPARPSDKNWVSEPPLILIKGRGTRQYIDSPVIEDLTIDYTSQRNGGGTDLDTLENCHPTPHSIGTIGIYVIYCLNPVFENLKFMNIYGSGIYCRKSLNPISRNLSFYNVSANQIVDRNKRMDRDNSGGAIFYWSCYGGRISDCVAWNTRTYNVKYLSPDNEQQIKNTICGYIGFWSEFSISRSDKKEDAPPLIDWLNVSKKDLDRVSRGIEISNCTVYGYVIGIKGEAAVDVAIINNKVLNCYLPITCSGVRGVIQRNFTDMLACEDVKCPQGGLEQKRSHLGGMTFTPKVVFNQSVEISHNYVRTRKYPAFTTSRLNLKFLYNYINIVDTAPIFRSVSQGDFYGLEVIGNTFVIEPDAKPQVSILHSNKKAVFINNTFESESVEPIRIIFQHGEKGFENNVVVKGNYFKAAVNLICNSRVSIEGNTFDTPKGYNDEVISINGNGSKFLGNDLIVNSSQNPKSLCINASNIILADNNISININGPTKGSGVFWVCDNAISTMLINNTMKNNKVDYSLVAAEVLIMPRMERNVSDGLGSLIWVTKSLKGPVVSTSNTFKGGFSRGDDNLINANLEENLWHEYAGLIGERVHYLAPIPGGKEGIVMTHSGWREFGDIAW